VPYGVTPAIAAARVFTLSQGRLACLDAKTGAACDGFASAKLTEDPALCGWSPVVAEESPLRIAVVCAGGGNTTAAPMRVFVADGATGTVLANSTFGAACPALEDADFSTVEPLFDPTSRTLFALTYAGNSSLVLCSAVIHSAGTAPGGTRVEPRAPIALNAATLSPTPADPASRLACLNVESDATPIPMVMLADRFVSILCSLRAPGSGSELVAPVVVDPASGRWAHGPPSFSGETISFFAPEASVIGGAPLLYLSAKICSNERCDDIVRNLTALSVSAASAEDGGLRLGLAWRQTWPGDAVFKAPYPLTSLGSWSQAEGSRPFFVVALDTRTAYGPPRDTCNR
jgi:hypothetical protein